MAQFDEMDDEFLAKAGFFLGAGLLVLGTGGEFVGHAVWGELPAWENTLFFYSAIVGLVTAIVVPLVFGIVRPLIE